MGIKMVGHAWVMGIRRVDCGIRRVGHGDRKSGSWR